jgi:hypothetical protein
VFAALSAARGRRIFHPQGITFDGRLRVEAFEPGASVLERGAVHDVIVRFSRALGTPRGRPDFLGLALRVADQQDLLLASSTATPLLRYVPLPAQTFAGTTFSSLLPFAIDRRICIAGARVHHVRADADDQLAEVAAAASRAPVAVTLALADVGRRWRRVAGVELGERMSDGDAATVAFDSWICEGGLVPRGRINALRTPAYRGSRRGRGVHLVTAAAAPPPERR